MTLPSAWAWLILGVVLVGAETLAPGVFLVWLGIAALLTGVLDWAFDLSWQTAGVIFALLTVLSVLAGRVLTRGAKDAPPWLGRGEALVGRSFTLDQPITDGAGRIRVGDSVWRVVGPDLPAGAAVRVARVDGATLVVEPA